MQTVLLAAFDNLDPMNGEALLKALNILWQGLVAIFVVIGLIVLAVKITFFILAKTSEMKKRREQAASAQTDERDDPQN